MNEYYGKKYERVEWIKLAQNRPKVRLLFENIIPHLFLRMHLVIILKLSMSVHTFYMYDDIQFGNLIIFYLQFVL